MTSDDWSAAFTARVAREVRAARKAASLTMAEVAQGCLDRGLELTEPTMKNLETGRRTTLTVAELVVLADALGVPPVTLLFPIGTTATVEVLPGREVSTWDALAWFTGETPTDRPAPEGSPRELLDAFRAHSDAVAAAAVSTSLARDRRRKASTTLDPARRTELLNTAAGYEQLAFDDCRALRTFRDTMRQRGLVPPELPTDLAFVDQPETNSKDDK